MAVAYFGILDKEKWVQITIGNFKGEYMLF